MILKALYKMWSLNIPISRLVLTCYFMAIREEVTELALTWKSYCFESQMIEYIAKENILKVLLHEAQF